MNSEKRDEPVYPVGERITYFRKLKGISTNRLANLSGISQSYLRDVELQKKNPTIEVVYLLCRALGISLKQFFDDDTTAAFSEDPLMNRIYRLNDEQRRTLAAFLDTVL